MKNTGTKRDAGKNRLELFPFTALTMVGNVLTFGAAEYGADNWRLVKGWRRRYMGAALRHVFKYMTGEHVDPETGLHHLSHSVCCLLFVLEQDLLGTEDGDLEVER